MPVDRSPLAVDEQRVDDIALLLAVGGTLDSTTYLPLRDAVIKAALDQPTAVVVDVSALRVPSPSAWSVFTSARWHVNCWPEVPIMLTCQYPAVRDEIARNGITRYVPVFDSAAAAVNAVASGSERARYRRRVHADLPAEPASVRRSRDVVAEHLADWGLDDYIPAAKMVVTVLVENVLAHTDSAPALRLESNGKTVTVAVEDDSTAPVGRHEDAEHGGVTSTSGLAILAALARRWGSAPTTTGKTVWAVLGPENRL